MEPVGTGADVDSTSDAADVVAVISIYIVDSGVWLGLGAGSGLWVVYASLCTMCRAFISTFFNGISTTALMLVLLIILLVVVVSAPKE